MKRIVAIIMMSAIVALSVVGCGGGGSGSSAAPEAPAAESVSEDANLVSASEYTDQYGDRHCRFISEGGADR